MTVLITADWHLSSNPRDEYRWVFVEKTLPKMIKEEGVELLLFLGDVCEEKDQHTAELVNRVAAAFERLAKLCAIVCLEGNHDWYSAPANPFFGFLSKLGEGAISWVGVPTPLSSLKNVPESVSRAIRGLLLPHSANPDRDWGDLDFSPYNYVFAHQSFAGALSESGHALSGVSMSWFPKGVKVISGDIHRPQENGNLIYVGSPYSVDFGDEIEPRVLLLDGKRLESIPVPGPQKRLVEMKSLKDLLKVKGLNKGDIIKVRIGVDSYDQWPAVAETLKMWAASEGVTLHQAQPIIQSPFTQKVELDRSIVKTDEELLKEYGKKRNLDEAHLNTGLKLL